jgi:hypothetical protein
MILLPQPYRCWDYRCTPPCLALMAIFYLKKKFTHLLSIHGHLISQPVKLVGVVIKTNKIILVDEFLQTLKSVRKLSVNIKMKINIKED